MNRALAGLVLAVVVAGACGSDGGATPSSTAGASASSIDDPTAPVVVTGRFLNGSNVPLAGATIALQVRDLAKSQPGQPVPMRFSAQTTSGLDGSFRFRFRVTDDLAGFAMANGGYLNMMLTGIAAGQSTDLLAFWSFTRQVAGRAFSDGAPTIVLRAGDPPPAP